jgi:hypothetical protein
MKQFLLLVAACVCSFWAMGQVTVLSENFDSDSIPALPNGWTTTTNFDIGFRTETSQPSDYAGASGLNNLVMRNTDSTGTYALYSPVFSTVGLIGLQMTFASRVSTNYLTPGSTTPILECSADNGATWMEVYYIENTNNSVWMPVNEGPLITLPDAMSESPNVQLRWTLYIVNDPSGSYRMDDVQVFGFPNPIATITLRVNMANEVVAPEGVFVAGDFNGWNASASPMTDLGGGIFEYQTQVQWNTTPKFRVYNGTATSEQVPDSCGVDDGQGTGTMARMLEVGQSNVVFGPVCFSSCDNCVIVEPVFHNVTFSVDMSQQILSPDGVFVVANVDGVADASFPMQYAAGIYSAAVPVLEGTNVYYRFSNGMMASSIEAVPSQCGVDNGSSMLVRELYVGNEDYTTTTVCFAECSACVQPFVDEANNASLQIYPNPASSFITLQGDLLPGSSFRIYDAIGTLIKAGVCLQSPFMLDVSELPAGIYYVVTPMSSGKLAVTR